MQAFGIGKPGLVSQLGRLATFICVCIFETERIPDIIASSLQCVFLLFLKSIDLGRPRLSSPHCHIDQCHCSPFPSLNIPWTHHSPVFDLHPHLILLRCCSSSFSPHSSALLFFPPPASAFLPSSAQWRRNRFMIRARGLSASTITRLYCNPIKLWQNGLRMIYSPVYVQCSLLCIFPLAHVRVHVCFCTCGCWVQAKLLLLMLEKTWERTDSQRCNREMEWALGRKTAE